MSSSSSSSSDSRKNSQAQVQEQMTTPQFQPRQIFQNNLSNQQNNSQKSSFQQQQKQIQQPNINLQGNNYTQNYQLSQPQQQSNQYQQNLNQYQNAQNNNNYQPRNTIQGYPQQNVNNNYQNMSRNTISPNMQSSNQVFNQNPNNKYQNRFTITTANDIDPQILESLQQYTRNSLNDSEQIPQNYNNLQNNLKGSQFQQNQGTTPQNYQPQYSNDNINKYQNQPQQQYTSYQPPKKQSQQYPAIQNSQSQISFQNQYPNQQQLTQQPQQKLINTNSKTLVTIDSMDSIDTRKSLNMIQNNKSQDFDGRKSVNFQGRNIPVVATIKKQIPLIETVYVEPEKKEPDHTQCEQKARDLEDEIEKLKDKLRKKEQAKKKGKMLNKNDKDKINDLEKQIEQLKNQIQDKDNQLDQYNLLIQQLIIQNSSFEVKIEDYQKILEIKIQENNEWQKKYQTLNFDFRNLIKDLDQKQTETLDSIIRVKSDENQTLLMRFKNNDQNINDHLQKINELEVQNNTQKIEIERLLHKLSEACEENHLLDKKNADLAQQLSDLNNKYIKLQSEKSQQPKAQDQDTILLTSDDLGNQNQQKQEKAMQSGRPQNLIQSSSAIPQQLPNQQIQNQNNNQNYVQFKTYSSNNIQTPKSSTYIPSQFNMNNNKSPQNKYMFDNQTLKSVKMGDRDIPVVATVIEQIPIIEKVNIIQKYQPPREDLSGKVKELEDQIKKLLEENENLKKGKNKEKAKKKGRQQQLQDKSKEYQDEIDRLKKKLQQKDEEIDDWKKKYQISQSELSKTKLEYQLLYGKLEDLYKIIDLKTRENNDWTDKYQKIYQFCYQMFQDLESKHLENLHEIIKIKSGENQQWQKRYENLDAQLKKIEIPSEIRIQLLDLGSQIRSTEINNYNNMTNAERSQHLNSVIQNYLQDNDANNNNSSINKNINNNNQFIEAQ